MEFKTLEKTNITQILDTFNLSFSDYLVPFRLTKEQLIAKMKADKTDLSYSIGAFKNEELVGFILHGYDILDGQAVLYNGGTGVIPNARGKGLTKRMYHFCFQLLNQKSIAHILLEVISNNKPAIKSYENVGFKITRTLGCYKGKVTGGKVNKELIIKEMDHYPWAAFEAFWSIHPTWQASKSTMDLNIKKNISLGAYLEDELVGYVLFNPINKRIQQIAVKKDNRRNKIASSLLNKLVKANGEELSMINIDKKDLSLPRFFETHGLNNYLDQYEMMLTL